MIFRIFAGDKLHPDNCWQARLLLACVPLRTANLLHYQNKS